MEKYFCCPQCGEKNLQVTTETHTQTTGKNYSGGQGCLGYLLFGPLGLLCGLCGQGQTTQTTNTTYWFCPNCGNKFEHPDSLRAKAKAFDTPIFPILSITGAVIALIFLMIFMEADAGIAFLLALFTASVFAALGYLGKKSNEKQKDEIMRKIQTMEQEMKKHHHE